MWDQAGYIARNCSERLSNTGDLVGMAFTARDMFQIVDALGEDGKLRYWGECGIGRAKLRARGGLTGLLGISGGTTLGATAAAMFPDRIDKVILDGVMNAHEYYHSVGYDSLFQITSLYFRVLIAQIERRTWSSPRTTPS